jgi:hypothetical protein
LSLTEIDIELLNLENNSCNIIIDDDNKITIKDEPENGDNKITIKDKLENGDNINAN